MELSSGSTTRLAARLSGPAPHADPIYIAVYDRSFVSGGASIVPWVVLAVVASVPVVKKRHVLPRLQAAFPLLVRRVALPGRLPLRQAASPAGGPEPQASSTSTPAEPEVPTNLTTWQYSKLADPGFAPW